MGQRKLQSSPRKKLQSAVELCIKRMREDKLKRRSSKKNIKSANIENKLLKSDIKSKASKGGKLGSDSSDDKTSGKVAPQAEKCTTPDIGKSSHTDGKGPSKLSTIDCSKYKTEESKGSKEEFQKGKQHSESFRPQANSTKPDSTKSKPLGKRSSTRVKSDEEHTEIDCQEIFARLQKESAKSRLKTRKTINCKKLAEILHSSKKAKSDKKAAYSGDDTRTPDTMGSTQGYSNKHALKADQNIDVSKCRPLDSKGSEKTPSSRIGSSTKIDYGKPTISDKLESANEADTKINCSKYRILGIDDSKKATSQEKPIAASCGKLSSAHQLGSATSSDKKSKANSEGVSGIDCSKYNISEKRTSTEGARNTAIDRGKPELAQQSEISKPIDCSKYRSKESKDSPPVDFKSQSSVDSKAAREILEAINETDFKTVCKKRTSGKETKPKDEPEPKVNIKDSGKSTSQETRFAERDCIKSDLVSKGSDNPKEVDKCQMQGSRAGFSDCSMVKSTGSQVSRTGSVCAKPERGDLKARDTPKSEAPTASPNQKQPSLACKKAEKKGTFAKGKTEAPDKARSCSPTKFETLQKDLRNKPIISCSTFMTPIIDSQKEKSEALSQFDRTSTKFGKGFEKPIPLGNEFMTAVNVLHEENLCKVPEARVSKKDSFQKDKSTSMGYSRCGINKPKSADNKYQTPETKNRINATHKKLTPTEGSGRESSKPETGIDCSKYKISYNKDTNKPDLQQGSSSAINYNKLAQVEQNTSTSPNCVSKTPGGTDYCKHKVSEVKNFAKATHAVGPGVQTSRPKMEEIKNIDCSKYTLGSKDKNKSLPEESSKPGSVHQTGPDKFKPMANIIDCSKYKVKELKDSSNANPERKSETRSVKGIDCNKYPTFNTSQEGKDANKATLQKRPASINRCARPVSAKKS
ncbi:uncharacterized protein LOC119649392 [Hermetia illucens]|uniref:uncharacterized protein LOC119649392 n=1 Tax=Hermetia illucens TaxID=343691 RepID=UPI0018CC3810|nr:uncharacterized protein LOC119649392 [Hermetia illucens]